MWISNCHCDFILQYVYGRVWVSSIFVKSSRVCPALLSSSNTAAVWLTSTKLSINLQHTHTHTLSLIWQSAPNVWAHCFVAALYWFVFVCIQVCAFGCGAVSTCDAWTYWQRPCMCVCVCVVRDLGGVGGSCWHKCDCLDEWQHRLSIDSRVDE